MRFRILELLIVVSIICFSITSIGQSTDWFETMFYSFTIGMILIAVAMSIARTGQRRCFWMAFAASTFLYLLLAHIPNFAENEDSFAYEYGLPRLRYDGPEITTQLLRYAYEKSRNCDLYNVISPSRNGGGGVFSLQDASPSQQDSNDPFGGSDQSDSSRGGFGGGVGGSFGGQNSDDPFGGGVTEADFKPLIDLIRSKGDADGTTLPFPPGTGGIVSARGIVSVRREIEDDFAQFMRIGHCSWALLIGWVSGHFCMFIASRSNGKIVTD